MEISVPAQHWLNNAYNIVRVLQAGEKIYNLTIVVNRRRWHGPGCGNFPVRTTRGDSSVFDPAMADARWLHLCVWSYSFSQSRVMRISASAHAIDGSICVLHDEPIGQ